MALFFMISYSPITESIASLEDSTPVDVTENNLITFTPQNI